MDFGIRSLFLVVLSGCCTPLPFCVWTRLFAKLPAIFLQSFLLDEAKQFLSIPPYGSGFLNLAALLCFLFKLSCHFIKAVSGSKPPTSLTGSQVLQLCWNLMGWTSHQQQQQDPLRAHTVPFCRPTLHPPFAHEHQLYDSLVCCFAVAFMEVQFHHFGGPNSCWKTSLKLLLKHTVAFLTIGLQLVACHMTTKTILSPTGLTAVFSVLVNTLIHCCHSLPSQEWPILTFYNYFPKHSNDPHSHTLSAFGLNFLYCTKIFLECSQMYCQSNEFEMKNCMWQIIATIYIFISLLVISKSVLLFL